jgi:hypothetical protein
VHPLHQRIQALIDREDIEALTCLLESWQPQDAFWQQMTESRLLAPSSSAAQKERLRRVLSSSGRAQDHRSIRGLIAEGANAIAPDEQTPSEPELGADSDRVCLVELKATLDLVASKAGCLPAELAPPAQRILARIERDCLRRQALFQEQYLADVGSRRLARGTRFSDYLHSLSRQFVQLGPPASTSEIEALEALAGASLDLELRAFYQTFGGLGGEFNDAGLCLSLFSPAEILAARDSQLRWRRISSPNLLQMARWSWSNDRPELEPGRLPEDVLSAASSTLCIGWLRDGYCEEHAYLVRMPNGLYQLHCWHQDHRFLAATNAAHQTRLFPLLERILDFQMRPRSEDEESRDIPSLIEALPGG